MQPTPEDDTVLLDVGPQERVSFVSSTAPSQQPTRPPEELGPRALAKPLFSNLRGDEAQRRKLRRCTRRHQSEGNWMKHYVSMDPHVTEDTKHSLQRATDAKTQLNFRDSIMCECGRQGAGGMCVLESKKSGPLNGLAQPCS